MEDKIKTKVSNRVAWIGYIISFLLIGFGILGIFKALFFGLSMVVPEAILISIMSIICGIIIYIRYTAFSKIVKAAEIYIEKNKNIIK